ncbi:MAG: carboxypeptidase regulatory-like domain-containing protein [Gemmatimonadaceae bacterium]|nr:carboxypeptidase regulatory-like domain-containing protein [Gemmatimonadaceae bacterium]
MTPRRPKFAPLIAFLVIVAAGLIVPACNVPSPEEQTADLPRGFSIAITNAQPIGTPQVGTTGLNVTVTRLAGFTGAVSLQGGLNTSGISITTTVVPSGVTSATVPLVTSASLGIGGSSVEILGVADGYRVESTSAGISVLSPGTFSLGNVGTTPVIIGNPGTSIRTSIAILRDTYSLPITFSAAAVEGIASTFTPATTTGNTVDVSVNIPASAALKSYRLQLSARGSDGQTHTQDVDVLVRLPAFSMQLSAPTFPILVGASGLGTAVVLRDPGFSGAISLSSDANLEMRVVPTTIAASASTATFQIVADNSVTPGLYDLAVTATSGTVTVTGSVAVAVGGFRLTPATALFNVTAPGSIANVVTLTRTDFLNAITVTGSSDAGIVVTANPASTTGTQTTVTVDVLSSAAAGPHTVTLTGTSGVSIQTTTFQVVVTAPTPNFVLDVQTAPLPVAAGASATDVVRFNRTNFTGAIAVTGVVAPLVGTVPPAITITATPATTTADQTVITVTAASSVVAGTYSATLTGTSGATIKTTTFAIVVGPPAGGLATRIVVTSSPVLGYIHPGGTVQFTGTALDVNGAVASDCPVGMAIDQSSIGSITSTSVSGGVRTAIATGVAPGTTALRAFCNDARTLATAVRLTVADQTFGVTQVNVSPRYIYKPSSTSPSTFQFAAAVVQNASPPLAPVVWSIFPTSGPVSIDQTGLITVSASTGASFGGGAVITATAFGQTDIGWVTYGNAGSIKGTMVSTSGQYLGGSTATATPTGGGASVVATLNNEGVFYLVGLPVGSYTVVVRQQGNPVTQTFNSVAVTLGGTSLLTLAAFP